MYLFNPFTLYSWTVGHNLAYLAYACAPLWVATFVRTMREKLTVTAGWRLGAVSLLFASAFASSPGTVLAMIVAPTLLLALLLGITRELRTGEIVSRSLAALAWCTALNAWWLIPIGRELSMGGAYSYAGSSWSLFEYPALATSVDFFEFIRGLGYWGAYQMYNGAPYVAWAAFLATPLAIAATVWLATCALLPLTQRHRPDLWVVSAGALFLGGVFFSKGLNPPAGDVNRWLYEEVPGFVLFRSTYQNFGGLAYLGAVIGLTILVAGSRLTRRGRLVVSGVTMVAVLVAGWPLLTGSVVRDQTQRGVSATVRIPSYYDDLARWSAGTKPGGSVLVLPMPPSGYIKTTWGLQGPDLIHNYIAQPVITGEVEARPTDGPRFRAFLTAATAFDEPVLLNKLGVAHVLVRHDISPGYYSGTADPRVIETRLKKAGFSTAATIGAFRITMCPAGIPRSRLQVGY